VGKERDLYVLVPDRARTAFLVVQSSQGPALPCLRGRGAAVAVLEAVRDAYGLEAPYLRTARIVRDESGRPTAALHELDAPPQEWELAPGTAWHALDDADPAALAPGELAADVERWLAEQRGAPMPEARPAWARPGWLAEASRWVQEASETRGLRPTGRVELVEQWPISSVLRLETEGGRVFFKAVFSTFRHEPAVTRALAESHPALVPEILAVDEERGWFLMRELRGTELGDLEVGRWSEGLRAIARIHLAWAEREAELFALGAHDRTLTSLARDIGDSLGAIDMPAADQSRLARARPELERLLRDLVDSGLPHTLVHGDLHPWNVMVNGDGLRLFDWSDACVSYPLFDLPIFLERVDDEVARGSMLEAYLACWSDAIPARELERLYTLSRPLAEAHHAISYARINDALEPDDRWWFAEEPARRLRSALDRVEAL
jgi:Ser/Thr protein kinase RdoA (MazF antagonist)